MKLLIKLIIFCAVISATQYALAEEGHHSIGIQGGQVLLSGDVASTYGNALGLGAFFNYAASDWLEFQLGWLNSKHTTTANGQNVAMTQNAFNADILYDIDQFDVFVPYVKGGVDLVTHSPQDVVGTTGNLSGQSYSGFGLNLGIGGQFILGKNFFTGLDITYHSIFDVSTSAPGASSVKVLQSFTTVLVQMGFRL